MRDGPRELFIVVVSTHFSHGSIKVTTIVVRRRCDFYNPLTFKMSPTSDLNHMFDGRSEKVL